MIVFFRSFCRSSSSSCNLSRISGSRAENGSSISRMSASVAKARARPTRCCMPPDNSWPNLPAHWVKPTMASLSATILSICSFGMRRSSSPKPTFSLTVRHGNSANCWNTMAMRLVRSIRSSSALQCATSMAPSPWRTSTLPRATLLRPLTARRIVDLPDPDRPIRTQISLGSMERGTPAAPRTTPGDLRISSRVAPRSTIESASACLSPNTMSTLSKTTADILRASFSLGITEDAIKHDRQENDRHASLDAHGNVDGSERAHPGDAEPRCANERRDDDHRQAQHDALGDAGHDRRQRVRQFHLPEQLSLRGSERLTGFLQRRRRRNDAEISQADRRGDGENDGGDQPRRRAKMK